MIGPTKLSCKPSWTSGGCRSSYPKRGHARGGSEHTRKGRAFASRTCCAFGLPLSPPFDCPCPNQPCTHTRAHGVHASMNLRTRPQTPIKSLPHGRTPPTITHTHAHLLRPIWNVRRIFFSSALSQPKPRICTFGSVSRSLQMGAQGHTGSCACWYTPTCAHFQAQTCKRCMVSLRDALEEDEQLQAAQPLKSCARTRTRPYSYLCSKPWVSCMHENVDRGQGHAHSIRMHAGPLFKPMALACRQACMRTSKHAHTRPRAHAYAYAHNDHAHAITSRLAAAYSPWSWCAPAHTRWRWTAA